MTKRKQAQLLGILFAEYQILTTEQASIVRQQMDKPSYVFADNNSLWAFYNYVTLALQQSHPKTWMEDQRILHYFINSVNNFPVCGQPAQVPVEETNVTEDTEANFNFKDVIEAIDPNQISLLDQIADMEADMMDEDIRYKHAEVTDILDLMLNADEEEIINEIEVEELSLEQPEESILQYTDKDGNTFEAIEFHNAAVEHSLTPTEEDYQLYEAEMISKMKTEEESKNNFDLSVIVYDDGDSENGSDFF
jgi:hypothetical protein